MEVTKILKMATIEKELMIDPLSVEVEALLDQVLVEKQKQLPEGLKLQIYLRENEENYEVVIQEVLQ